MEEESVYNIVKSDTVPEAKKPLYKSRFNSTMPPTCSTFGLAQTSLPGVSNVGGEQVAPNRVNHSYRRSHAYLGTALGVVRPNPKVILRRCSKTKRIETLKQLKATHPDLLVPSQAKERVKPPLPAKTDKPIMNLVSSKDYVVANAVENILSAPKKLVRETKDYIHKPDYGQVPKYLNTIKKDIKEEYDYIRKMKDQEENDKKAKVRLLPEEDRKKLLDALKAKWENVNTDYQATTHMTKLDTIGKIRRKEQYEAQLGQIEKDIQKLGKGYIFVDQEH